MGFNFPSAPMVGEVYPVTPAAGIPTYKWDGEKWVQVLGITAPAEPANPLMDGAVAVGSSTKYARGDHKHPTDSSRAPLSNPTFTGTFNTDSMQVNGAINAGTHLVSIGNIVSQMGGAGGQPSIGVHAQRGYAMGFFLDTSNRIGFGSMNGSADPLNELMYIDGSGNVGLSGTLVLGSGPGAAMHVATKTYVDGRMTPAGTYLPMAGGTMTGQLTGQPVGAWVGSGTWCGSVEVRGNAEDAYMTFHRPNAFATFFGLRSDNNIWMGGWSYGTTTHRFWTTKDFGGLPVTNGRMTHAGDQALGSGAALTELSAGAAITGGTGYTYQTVIVTYRWRHLQILTNAWYTTGWV